MQTIYLDISNKGVVPTIYAKQGDVGRKFEVVFTDSGIPYSIPTNAKISIWYEGDSGVGNYTDIGENSAIAIGENKAVVELITQMLSEDGEGIVSLVMNAGNNQIGSWNIRYLCERVPGFDSEGAKEYYTAFSKTVESLKQVTENLTPESIGAAPAGYGLGDVSNMQNICDWATLNAATASGWYYVTLALNGFSNSVLRVDSNDDIVVQHQFAHYNGLWVELVRSKIGGWSDWEWVNPPMTPGIEYRTTERWDGKPVWTSLTKISGLPNVAYGQYNLAAFHCDNVIRKHISYERADGATFLNLLEAGDVYIGSYGSPYICFNRTTSDLSSMTAYVTLFYTKTTD